ncbi:hypothetical protein HNY73_008085 [Argiope bruennichi]|uniref:Uncharacterized protein n=1 Tax=Argiope bruennichi TaxID=94029 RepID=A0A8T0F581_ARGBR|nr:hypothetical protein HNY73_008085 [Argiope bruennichi]
MKNSLSTFKIVERSAQRRRSYDERQVQKTCEDRFWISSVNKQSLAAAGVVEDLPANNRDINRRVQERQRRQAAKARLEALYEKITDYCPAVKVTRALFNRRKGNYLGMKGPALSIALKCNSGADSPEENLVPSDIPWAPDVAIFANRNDHGPGYIPGHRISLGLSLNL